MKSLLHKTQRIDANISFCAMLFLRYALSILKKLSPSKQTIVDHYFRNTDRKNHEQLF